MALAGRPRSRKTNLAMDAIISTDRPAVNNNANIIIRARGSNNDISLIIGTRSTSTNNSISSWCGFRAIHELHIGTLQGTGDPDVATCIAPVPTRTKLKRSGLTFTSFSGRPRN